MSLINKQIKPFTAEAFKDGAFVTVSDEDIKGKWAIFFFYPRRLHVRLPDRARRPR